MSMSRDSQRYAAQRCRTGQISRRQRRKRNRLLKKAAMKIARGAAPIALGSLLGLAILYAFTAEGVAPDSIAAGPMHQQRYYVEGGDYYYTSLEDYEQYQAERQAYLDAEAAETEELMNAVREAQDRANDEYEAQWMAYQKEREYRSKIYSRDWDADDSMRLMKIAMAEAEGEDARGKALVMLTVLNRVWSEDFPGTIQEVIEQTGAFTAYTNGRYDAAEPDQECYEALDMIMTDGWDASQGATYFESTSNTNTWHKNNLTKLFQHGNHIFYTE